MTCPDCERLLPQYVDRELDEALAERVAEHAAGCPVCRERLSQAQNLSLLVQRAPYYEAPERLRAALGTRAPRQRVTPRLVAIAATALLAVAGTAVVVPRFRTAVDARRAADAGSAATIAAEVVDNHVRALMADRVFEVASTDQHTVKPWFAGKLDFSPPVVDLASEGYPLQGGRLDYVGGRRVAALVYTRRKHTIDVFAWPASEPDRGISTETLRGFHVLHWTHGGMSLWAVSDLNEAELQQFVALQGGP